MTNNVTLLVARMLMAVMFVGAGINKLVDPGTAANAGSMAGMVAAKGLPLPVLLTYLAGLLELAGGLAVLAGFFTRLGALALAAFCVLTALLFHIGATGDPVIDALNPIMMLKNLAITGGFLVIAVAGPGSLSVDARRR